MKYICKNCGALIEEEDLSSYEEDRGEFWGAPVTETIACCPCCGNDELSEAEQCEVCGQYFDPDNGEIHYGVCSECIDEYATEWEFWKKACDKEQCTESLEVNAFLLSQFSKEEIEQILTDKLREKEEAAPIDCREFMEGDPIWTSEIIIAHEKEEE